MVKKIDPLTRYIVNEISNCWVWTGPIDKQGYARHARLAHRLIYEKLVGPVPKGLELDHLCHNPKCVNPDHLEPVTHKENVRRGVAGIVNAFRQISLTHCKRGHEFTKENTRIDRKGHRCCRTCSKLLHDFYYYRNLEIKQGGLSEKQRRRYLTRRSKLLKGAA